MQFLNGHVFTIVFIRTYSLTEKSCTVQICTDDLCFINLCSSQLIIRFFTINKQISYSTKPKGLRTNQMCIRDSSNTVPNNLLFSHNYCCYHVYNYTVKRLQN